MNALDDLKQRIEAKLAAAEIRNEQHYRHASGNAMEGQGGGGASKVIGKC